MTDWRANRTRGALGEDLSGNPNSRGQLLIVQITPEASVGVESAVVLYESQLSPGTAGRVHKGLRQGFADVCHIEQLWECA
jgi:hypothetical protein